MNVLVVQPELLSEAEDYGPNLSTDLDVES